MLDQHLTNIISTSAVCWVPFVYLLRCLLDSLILFLNFWEPPQIFIITKNYFGVFFVARSWEKSGYTDTTIGLKFVTASTAIRAASSLPNQLICMSRSQNTNSVYRMCIKVYHWNITASIIYRTAITASNYYLCGAKTISSLQLLLLAHAEQKAITMFSELCMQHLFILANKELNDL